MNNLGGVYTTGTLTIAGDRISVTGVGTLWGPIAEIGDWILIGGQVGLVLTVTDDTHITLQSPWQGTLPSTSAYVLIKMSWLRYEPALTQAKLRELLAYLEGAGSFIFTSVAPPDPALGQDGDWALKTDVLPWQLWLKTGGIWVEQPPNTALLPEGTSGHHLVGKGLGSAAVYEGFAHAGTGAITRGWRDKLRDQVSVLDFGADPTGVIDSTAAFQNALIAHKAVFAPAGSYKIDGTVVMLAFCSLRGESRGNTKLIASTANLPLVRFPSGIPQARLSDFTLDRSVTATSGGDGIVFVEGGNNNYLENLTIDRQWRGMALSSTDSSWARHITIENCQSHGLFMTNAATQAAAQWQLHDIYSVANVGSGFFLASTEGASGMICGKMSYLQSYANSGYGFAAFGTATAPVYNIRVANAHFGSDNGTVFLHTFGSGHVFNDLVIEFSGTWPTGPGGATPATNVGAGVEITANNRDCRITGLHITGSADQGILSGSERLFVSNGLITDNGQAGISRSGIGFSAGKVYLTNLVITNVGAAGTGQTYGVVAGADTLIMMGCDLTGNVSGPLYELVPLVNSHIVACWPTSLSSLHPNMMKGFTVGGIVVGAVPSASAAAGAVNVHTGVYKDGVPYTPPVLLERLLDAVPTPEQQE